MEDAFDRRTVACAGALFAVMGTGIVLCSGATFETLRFLILAAMLSMIAVIDVRRRIIPNALVLAGVVAWVALMLVESAAIVLDGGLLGSASDSAVAAGSIVARETFGASYGVQNTVSAGESFISSIVSRGTQGLIGALCLSLPTLLLALLMEKATGKMAFGGGDIKLLFMLGLYFPWQEGLVGLLFSCVVAVLMSLGDAALRKMNAAGRKEAPPFAIPFGTAAAIGFWLVILLGGLGVL